MRKLLFLLCAVCSLVFASAIEAKTVKGTVLDASTGEPLIGATIMADGTNNGVATDLEGRFSFNVPDNVKNILVSYVGYDAKVVPAAANVKVELEKANTQLDDVIVVAYGTAKKSSITGSASSIDVTKLESRPITNVTKAIEGQVTGVLTTTGSGQPGSSATIRVRGYGSINASSEPLYVVDGIPYDGSLSSINPSDIESMTILKDASAGALYGARGANGVVMITTKKGKEGKASVNWRSTVGWASRAIKEYDMLNQKDFFS